jgi:epoxyqueuosine reductase
MSKTSPNKEGAERDSRRKFLKLGLAGAGVAAVAAGGVTVVKRMEGIPQDEFPLPIRDEYKPIDQRNVVLTFAHSKALNDKHPERIKKFGDFPFHERHESFMKSPPREAPGYSQLERALAVGGFSGALGQIPSVDATNSGVGSWEQKMLAHTQYQFKNPNEAALAIKSAARTFGALRCGITKRDKRWDYQPIYDWQNERELSFENDFPFTPKSVIVIMTEMDFHAMAAAPSWMADATVGNGYANAIKIAGQLAVFCVSWDIRQWPR